MSETPQLTVAVLGFLGESTARACLSSIRARVHVPYTLVYLDNGGAQDWVWELYREGLCDHLISKRDGGGGGVGQTDLFRWASTPYTLFVQQDHLMAHPLTRETFAHFAHLLDGGYHCIDLNGAQGGLNHWTDRAHLIKTALFNGLAPFPNGGPGAKHHLRWNENYLQEVFETRRWQIAHISPTMFRDAGVWTVRRHPDGSLLHMRTDTKALWWEALPTEPYVFPQLTEAEWASSIAGTWVGGTIPEHYFATPGASFSCWGPVVPPSFVTS